MVLVRVGIRNRLKVTVPLKRNYVMLNISEAQTDDERPPLTSYSSLAIVSAALSSNKDFRRARE